MKNKNLIVIIIMMIMSNISKAQNSTCILNLPDNMPVIHFTGGVSYGDLDIQNRNVIISDNSYGVTFLGNTKFTNCRITITNQPFRYTDKKYEFYNCQIFLQSPSSAFRGLSTSFEPTNSELIFDGNCIFGENVGEPLHVEDSNFRFVNNFVDISTIGHVFHFVNLKPTGDNSFYGNNINNSGVTQGVIKVDQSSQTELKIGDNTQSKNIFYSGNNVCIAELGSSTVPIRIENTEFYGNRILYIANNSKLTIDNCKFKSQGSNSFGIKFANGQSAAGNGDLISKNSSFQGYDRAIETMRGNLDIQNCTFLGNNNAIKVSKSSANGNGEIKSNTFTSNNIDVFATGSFIELEVSGNNFSGREFGFLADGHNNYELKNNSFYNSYAGSIAYANGANNNFVEGNRYYTLIGTHALEDNSSYQFTDNCFTTAGGDVYLDGSVASAVGSEGAEANNCFTRGGIPDISATTNAFEYYRSDNSPICEDPKTSGTYTDLNATLIPQLNCGSGTPFSSTVRKYCSISFKYTTCKQAKLMLVQIDKDIADVTISTSYRAKVKDNILKALKNCRVKILAFLKTCIDPKPEDPRFPDGEISAASWTGNEPDLASSLLKTSSDKYERTAYVNTMILLGSFAEINAYLQSYSSEDEEEADFIAVQKINVARFLSQDEYVPSQDDVYTLQLAANKPYPLAAYARGLYTQLTGDIIMPPIPRIAFNRSIAQKSSSFGIMPNPVSDQLQVSIPPNQSCELRISDITGKTYYQKNMLDIIVDVNTSTWPAGVYFVVCTNEQGIGECKKLIKQ